MVLQISQKANQILDRFLPYEAKAEICQKFGWLFGRFVHTKNSFWDWLTFSNITTLCYFWLLKRPIIFDSMINSEWCLGTILKRSNLFTFFFFTHAPKWSICYLASWSLACNCNPRTIVSEHWVCTSLIFLQNYLPFCANKFTFH